MTQRMIALIIGSLRRDSINRKLANAVIKLAPREFSFKELKFDDLPPYNQDLDDSQPVETKRLKAEVSACDGLLFVTPEYNRSIPGVLKNALDHASRPHGRNAWAQKPAGILSGSIGAIGGAIAQQHLRNTLAYLDVPTFNQPEAFIHIRDGFFDATGGIANDATRKFLQSWMDQYCAWIAKILDGKSAASN